MESSKMVGPFFRGERKKLFVVTKEGGATASLMCVHVLQEAKKKPGTMMQDSYFAGDFAGDGGGESGDGAKKRRLELHQKKQMVPEAFVVEIGLARLSDEEKDVSVFDRLQVEEDDVVIFMENELKVLSDGFHVSSDVVSNVDHRYEKALTSFVKTMPSSAELICDERDGFIRKILARNTRAKVTAYGFLDEEVEIADPDHLMEPALWHVVMVKNDETGSLFDLYAGGMLIDRFGLHGGGRHLVRQALATIVALSQGFHLSFSDLKSGLLSFSAGMELGTTQRIKKR